MRSLKQYVAWNFTNVFFPLFFFYSLERANFFQAYDFFWPFASDIMCRLLYPFFLPSIVDSSRSLSHITHLSFSVFFISPRRGRSDFISRDHLSYPWFPSRHYFPDITQTYTHSHTHFLPFSCPLSFLLAAALQRRVRSRTLSSYILPILCTFQLSSCLLNPRPSAYPFLLSEGHWNRIKLYAGFSMRPFPPGAMKGGIRHASGPDLGEIGGSRSNGGSDEISSWPFIKRRNVGRGEKVENDEEKRTCYPFVQGDICNSRPMAENKKKRQPQKEEAI